MEDLSKYTLEQLEEIEPKLRRRANALAMGNLADMRVATYEYPSDASDRVLKRNEEHYRIVFVAANQVTAEIKRRREADGEK